MKKLITHSKSSLFLIEMILSILILALTCTVCVRIFAAAKTQREEARELNHIQELVTSAGETLEGWNGQLSSFISIFGQPSKTSGALLQYYYDDSWNPCTENSAEYTMTIQPAASETEKTADINFYNSQHDNLYQLSVTFLSVGIPSMCTIFSVLCLVILALLTLNTSEQDLQTSRIALEQTTAYYTACSAASSKYQELTAYAQQAFTDCQKKQTYNTLMSSVTQQYPDARWDPKTQILSFTVDFAEKQAIYVEINIPYSSDLIPEILTWKTISTAAWNPDTRQPVYKGDSK